MTRNNVGVAQAPRATIRFGNPDNVLDNEEATNRASEESNGSLRANGRLCRVNNDEQCREEVKATKSEVTRLSGVAPDCPVQQDDKPPQRSTAPNPNGCADVARTGPCTITVRCAHR
jgi:hypothetical protein